MLIPWWMVVVVGFAFGDKVDFQFDLMENYGLVGAESPDNMIVFTQ